MPESFVPPAEQPAMFFQDTSRWGRPYAKDPSVVKFQGRYLMYYSIPPFDPMPPNAPPGWGIGVAESRDLLHWKKVGELLPQPGGAEEKGICAPGARILNGKLHLFYQTYGNGPQDAICHAVSTDGLHFTRDSSNPVFHPPASHWSIGRAIDAEVFAFKGKLYLYYATRDPNYKIQMLGVAVADLTSDFGRAAWKDLSASGPMLKPELPWEKDCIEAATVCQRGDTLYLFYAGAYNNAPQQIGCATSKDAIHWTRVSNAPLLPVGKTGTWNASESGHPGVFQDDDGKTYLFYQGNADHGKTWLLSRKTVVWDKNGLPVLKD